MTQLPSEPHRRHDPLRDQWVLVSTGRTERPWSGQVEQPPGEARPQHDPGCYLCPGNTRAGGVVNPDYDTTFVFTNDFASLRPETRGTDVDLPLMRAEVERGTCRVICFSPRHDLTLARMGRDDLRRTVQLWTDQYAELSDEYAWVQVFENRGEAMGASNPHPHGQIWAGDAIPTEALVEDRQQRAHLAEHGEPLLTRYAALETADGRRVVTAGEHWLAVVPFWARWPFETMLLPRRPVQRLDALDDAQRDDLTDVVQELLVRYDNLFTRSFPYSMGWHNAPGRADAPHWTLHAHFYPPLLRAEQQKFMVGYEMLAESQRDVSPEDAAAWLREQQTVHHATHGADELAGERR